MSNESLPVCPQCGAVLKASAPAGLCPNCLMGLNLKTETVFTDDPPAAQPPLPPEQLAPHFPQLEILEFLGRGGMGVVYKARQKTLNRLVALKLLAPERVGDAKFAERFTREAQALAALNHPNIVTIHDFGQAGGFYFLLMEFVDGLNLRQLLRARKFTPEEALAIVPPLCDALQFAHDRGIIHRDIKPENLLLDKAGRVKVADFGIAKMIEPESGRADLPVSPEIEAAQQHGPTGVMGTPGYSAPEQKTDPQRVDSRADIYSLGVVFYEMLTGELPGKRIEPPSRKVQIDVRLDEVVLRALEKQPALRYQQVSEVKTCVETIAASPPGGSRREEAHSGGGNANQRAVIEKALSHVKAPAIGLLVAGIINLVLVFVLLAEFVAVLLSYQAISAGATPHPPGIPSRLLFFLPLGVTFLAAGAIIVFGAVRMQRLRGDGWSVAASILAMITPPGLLLGLPFGIWALIVLNRREIKAGFDAASRKRTMESAAAPPHYSRTAIVGACCLALTVLAGAGAVLAASQSMYLALQTPHLSRPLPPQIYEQGRTIFLAAMLSQVFGAVCALAGTVFGWIAVSQIRRSNGKIRGLGLAMVDGMLFPSLALIAVLWMVWFSLLDWIFPLLQVLRIRQPSLVFSMLVWLPWLAGSLWLCVWLAKQVRRAVNRPLSVLTHGGHGHESAPSEAEGLAETQPRLASAANPQRYGGWAFGFFLAGTLGTLLLMTISPRHELALIFGGMALVLALIFGMMGWRERLGKGVVIVTLVLLVGLGMAVAILAGVWVLPGQRRQAEAHRRELTQRLNTVTALEQEEQHGKFVFGPVMEREIEYQGGVERSRSFLDLETGTVFTQDQVLGENPGRLNKDEAEARWNVRGIDACYQPGKDSAKAFRVFGGRPVEDAAWEAWDATKLRVAVAVIKPEWMVTLVETTSLPITYAIKTREGGAALLQITGFTENLRGVKIRYKLTQSKMDKSSVSQPAGAAAFGMPQEFPVVPGKADNLDSTYLDLDTGRSTTMRLPIIGGSSWLRNWLEQEGMDVRVTTDPDSAAPFKLTYYNMTVTPMTSNAWPEAEAQEVINSLGPRSLKAEPPPLMGGPVIRFFFPKQDRTDCYSFRTREGGVGILQIAGFTDNPRDVKIRYKLVQAGRATNINSATSRVSLADPPKLQFLAWQDEWKTNQPAAARHPDGSLVTNATELSWLPEVHPTGMDVSLLKLKPEPRFLHLWFSHAAFDQVGLKQISLLDEQGKAVELGGQGSVSGSTHTANDRNGNLGWYTATLSPGGGTNVPTRVTLRFRYTLGPMERTQVVASDFSGMMSLEGGSQLNGIGQNAEARAFIAIAVDTRNMGSRQFGVVAITKDGRELPPAGSGRGGAVGGHVGVEHFDFEVPLAEVAKFRIGTNPIRTVEWKDVVLP